MSRVLLTGAKGFIASHVRPLLEGHEVVGIDSIEEQVHGPSIEFRLRCGEIPAPLPSVDIVIHLAAKVGVGQSMYQPSRYIACNTLDTAQFLKTLSMTPPKRLVVASSMSVYGEGGRAVETQAPDIRSVYALTKFDQEQLCLMWGRMHGVPVVALRFFNTWGPGQALTNPYTGVMAIFATRLLNRKAPVIYEDGMQTRDFVHVKDVAEAVVRAATTDMPAGIYNVGTGDARTIHSVAVDLAEALHVDIAPVMSGTRREGDIRHCYADNGKLLATGWQPKRHWKLSLLEYAHWLRRQMKPEDRFDVAARELEAAGLVK